MNVNSHLFYVVSADLSCYFCLLACECCPAFVLFAICWPLSDLACQDVSAALHLFTACWLLSLFLLTSLWVSPFDHLHSLPGNVCWLLLIYLCFTRMWVPLMHAHCLLASFSFCLLHQYVSVVYSVCYQWCSNVVSYLYQFVIFRNKKFPFLSHLLKQ